MQTEFNSRVLIQTLKENKAVFKSILQSFTHDQVYWRPEGQKWNMLEIVCHLYDEEREDFRQRLRFALEQRQGMPPSIDPEGWVVSRNYASRQYPEMVNSFLKERQKSIRYLEKLGDVHWDLAWEHPKLGSMSAKLFLTNWAAHDLLHLRQILRIKYRYIQESTGGPLTYAGEW